MLPSQLCLSHTLFLGRLKVFLPKGEGGERAVIHQMDQWQGLKEKGRKVDLPVSPQDLGSFFCEQLQLFQQYA